MSKKYTALFCLVGVLLLGACHSALFAKVLIGVPDPCDPCMTWDTTDAVTVTASSSYLDRIAVNTANGSGMDYGLNLGGHPDIVHDRIASNMWLSGTFADSAANPAPAGTVGGKHWIHFVFDRTYKMEQMWLWNSAEMNYANQGMKSVTIQYSAVDNPGVGDWTTIFSGNLAITTGANSTLPTSHDSTIMFNGVRVKHVVITSSNTAWNFYPSFLNREQVGLCEVQFYSVDYPRTCAETFRFGYSFPMDTNRDCYVNLADLAILAADWLTCVNPTDANCPRAWEN